MKNANGLCGTLLIGMRGNLFFRVYNEDKSFIDYDIRNQDLDIKILDGDAVIYNEETDQPYIDYSPETLGIKK